MKILLFDLDETLLTSNKTISKRTLESLEKCRNKGYAIGISTSRGVQNCLSFFDELKPDVLITSGGALVTKDNKLLYKNVFSIQRTKEIISLARKICGNDIEITADTIDNFYWNYKVNPKDNDKSWGETTWDDFNDFNKETLKITTQIFDEEKAEQLKNELTDCDCRRFSGKYWYKFTKKGVTKEIAIREVCKAYGVDESSIIAFGDDFTDIEMLKAAGTGVAMGNAISEVKAIADVIIGTNDEDGIADYLNKLLENE